MTTMLTHPPTALPAVGPDDQEPEHGSKEPLPTRYPGHPHTSFRGNFRDMERDDDGAGYEDEPDSVPIPQPQGLQHRIVIRADRCAAEKGER